MSTDSELRAEQWSSPSFAEVRAVEAIALSLDALRETCADLGLATLVAEVRGLPSQVICTVLDRLRAAGEEALAELLQG